jgi:hypothetical protein
MDGEMASYRISKHVAIEHFDEGSLVLLVPQRRIIELDLFNAAIIKGLENDASTEAIFHELASRDDCPTPFDAEIMLQYFEQLKNDRVLEWVPDNDPKKAGVDMAEIQYLRDPDVVIREEDPEEGALLFHPDTNQVKVLNATGFFIWQQCDQPATQQEIIQKILAEFEEAPEDEVTHDVAEFIEEMVATGFVGSVSPFAQEE